VWAAWLVADREVKLTFLVVAEGTDGVANVVKNVVLGDPAVGLIEAARQIVDAVGSAQRQLGVIGINEVGALRRVNFLIFHGHTTTSDGLVGSRLAGLQVGPGIVADVVSASGLVDAKQVDGTAFVAQLDANVIAVDRARPVGNTIGVDLTSQDTD
jgi:hypothetical protein